MTGERDRAIQVSLPGCLAGLVSLTKFWNRENEDQRCIICNSIFVLDSSVADLNPKTGGSQKVRMQIVKKKNRAQLKLFLLIIIILWRKIYLDDVLKSNEGRYWADVIWLTISSDNSSLLYCTLYSVPILQYLFLSCYLCWFFLFLVLFLCVLLFYFVFYWCCIVFRFGKNELSAVMLGRFRTWVHSSSGCAVLLFPLGAFSQHHALPAFSQSASWERDWSSFYIPNIHQVIYGQL